MPKTLKKKKPPVSLKKAKRPLKNGKLKPAAVSARPARPKPVERPRPVPLTAELKQMREKLMQMLKEVRNEIAQEVKGASDRDLAHITDSSDIASDAAEGDLAFRIAESEGVELAEIQKAIDKIDNGSYGVCESCNRPIGAERLRFLPFAIQCIRCQELAEIHSEEEGDELDDLSAGEESGGEES